MIHAVLNINDYFINAIYQDIIKKLKNKIPNGKKNIALIAKEYADLKKLEFNVCDHDMAAVDQHGAFPVDAIIIHNKPHFNRHIVEVGDRLEFFDSIVIALPHRKMHKGEYNSKPFGIKHRLMRILVIDI